MKYLIIFLVSCGGVTNINDAGIIKDSSNSDTINSEIDSGIDSKTNNPDVLCGFTCLVGIAKGLDTCTGEQYNCHTPEWKQYCGNGPQTCSMGDE